MQGQEESNLLTLYSDVRATSVRWLWYMRLSDEGISHRTAEDTKKEIGVRCYRKMRQWYWSLKLGEGEQNDGK